LPVGYDYCNFILSIQQEELVINVNMSAENSNDKWVGKAVGELGGVPFNERINQKRKLNTKTVSEMVVSTHVNTTETKLKLSWIG
jgi:hypothetical protein